MRNKKKFNEFMNKTIEELKDACLVDENAR